MNQTTETNKRRILSIGRDSTIADTNSQFHARFKEYCKFHDHTLFVLNKGESREIKIENSVIYIVGGKSLPTAFLKTLFKVWQEARKTKYDLVTTQDVLYAGLVGFIIANLFLLPLFVQLHGDYLDNDRWFKSDVGKFNRLMNGVGKFILKRADKIRVVSDRLKKQVIANYNLEAGKIISIPIGTDTSLFTPQNDIVREPVIVFAQRLIPEKKPMLFVAVTVSILQKFPDVKVTIAGDGFLKSEMMEAYEKAGVLESVTFLGAVAQKSLVSLYQSSMCYLHTADWEGWGMPMIEAMASGCPVVTTDTGCAGEAVRDKETGLVVPIDDEAGLIKATESLFNDKELWSRLSKQGIVEASEWSFKALTKKNMEWYAGVNE